MPPRKIFTPGGAWARYEPTAESPWDLRRVAHLHRRAGFAATWEELQRDLGDGPDASLDRLLSGRGRTAGVPEGFEVTAALLAESAVASGDPMRLKAWWIYRMMLGPDPLGERLALLWHDHFATAIAKVEDLALMRRQNESLRRLARAPFGALLNAAVREPALLLYLDAPANRKGHPNENLARELMELFTLGVGRYAEPDVKEAARALTGWTVAEGQFRDDPARHDPGPKTILGRSGAWTGADLVAILLEQPATPARLARRVCGLLMGEGVVDDGAVAALAEGLRAHDLDVGWAVGTVLRSRAFFAEANLGNRVLGPVEFVVGSARALGRLDPPASTLVLADWSARLGQDLFDPPNVGGWPGGRLWLTTRAMIGRANYAAALVAGEGAGRCPPLDALGLASRHAGGDVVGFAARVLLGRDPDRELRGRIASAAGPNPDRDPEAARRAVALVLASPEAQLG